MRHLSLFLILLPVAGSSAQATLPLPDTGFAHRIAGCYLIAPGPWQRDTAVRQMRAVPADSIRFQLSAEVVLGERPDGPVHLATSDSLLGYPHGLFSIWAPTNGGANRVRIGQLFPFADFSLLLSPVGRDLDGELVVYGTNSTDVIPSGAVPVTARRVTCAPRP